MGCESREGRNAYNAQLWQAQTFDPSHPFMNPLENPQPWYSSMKKGSLGKAHTPCHAFFFLLLPDLIFFDSKP